jgi:hypothetical protein
MRCRLAELAALAALAACAGTPAPSRPVLSNRAPPSSAIHWHGVDESHWIYELSIDGDRFTQVIHQATGSVCTQVGTISQQPTEILRTFDRNDCNHSYDHRTVHDTLVSRDATHLVVRMEGNYLIRYDRAP